MLVAVFVIAVACDMKVVGLLAREPRLLRRVPG